MISIIITAYKEPKTLCRQLKTILYQLSRISPPAEILVISPDLATQKVALKYHKINQNVKLIKDKERGKPAALNLALKQVKGDILILTDGDVEIDQKAILAILKPFKNPKIGATGGRPISTNRGDNMLGFWSHLLLEMAHKTRLKKWKQKKYLDCSGYLYALRQGIVKKIPENTLSDDALISRLVWKRGYKISYAPEAKVYVKYPDNFSDWIKQKKRSTGGYVQIPGLLKKTWKNNVGANPCVRPTRMKPKIVPRQPPKMRGLRQEIQGVFQTLKFAKNLKELWWTIILIFARIYLWFLIFWEIKIKKRPFDQVWQRVGSTK